LIRLDILDLALALGMMAIIGLSAWERLGLEWSLAIATGRTVLQLLVVGYILEFISLSKLWAVLAVLLVMLTIAAIVARNRISKSTLRCCLGVGVNFGQYRLNTVHKSAGDSTTQLV